MRLGLLWTIPFLLGACITPLPRYLFEPRPLVVRVLQSPGGDVETGRILISFLEFQRSRVDEGIELQARIRIENSGQHPIRVLTSEMLLVSADLKEFGKPRVFTQPDPVTAPGGEEVVDLYFPLPEDVDPDQIDFSGLNLRCSVDHGSHRSLVSMEIRGTRLYPCYYYSCNCSGFHTRYHGGWDTVGYWRPFYCR